MRNCSVGSGSRTIFSARVASMSAIAHLSRTWDRVCNHLMSDVLRRFASLAIQNYRKAPAPSRDAQRSGGSAEAAKRAAAGRGLELPTTAQLDSGTVQP